MQRVPPTGQPHHRSVYRGGEANTAVLRRERGGRACTRHGEGVCGEVVHTQCGPCPRHGLLRMKRCTPSAQLQFTSSPPPSDSSGGPDRRDTGGSSDPCDGGELSRRVRVCAAVFATAGGAGGHSAFHRWHSRRRRVAEALSALNTLYSLYVSQAAVRELERGATRGFPLTIAQPVRPRHPALVRVCVVRV